MRFIAILGVSVCTLTAQWFSMAAMSRAADFPEIGELPSIKELPDPLVMLDGTRVTTPEQWSEHRKPELKALFQHYMYGEMPAAPKIAATVRQTDRDGLGGKATMKQVTIAFGPPECPTINLLLFVPNDRNMDRAPPVVLGLNFGGNHTVLDDPRIALAKGWLPNRTRRRAESRDRGRPRQGRRPVAGRACDRARLRAGHFLLWRRRPRPSRLRRRRVSVLPQGRTRPSRDRPIGVQSPPGPGACSGPSITSSPTATSTPSESSSSAIRATARRRCWPGRSTIGSPSSFRIRRAAAARHQADSNNPKAESVTKINDSFPHWFDAEFKKFGGHEDKLPFDQNCLVAVCPRGPCSSPAASKTNGPTRRGSSTCSNRQARSTSSLAAKGLRPDAVATGRPTLTRTGTLATTSATRRTPSTARIGMSFSTSPRRRSVQTSRVRQVRADARA